jgi:hypothetical protein
LGEFLPLGDKKKMPKLPDFEGKYSEIAIFR